MMMPSAAPAAAPPGMPGGMDMAAMLQMLSNPAGLAASGQGMPPMTPEEQALLMQLLQGQTPPATQPMPDLAAMLQMLGGDQGPPPGMPGMMPPGMGAGTGMMPPSY